MIALAQRHDELSIVDLIHTTAKSEGLEAVSRLTFENDGVDFLELWSVVSKPWWLFWLPAKRSLVIGVFYDQSKDVLTTVYYASKSADACKFMTALRSAAGPKIHFDDASPLIA